MGKWFATYFGFSRRELNGVSVLVLVLLLLWIIPRVFLFRGDPVNDGISSQVAEIEEFLATVNERVPRTDSSAQQPVDGRKAYARDVTYFNFYPNGLAVDDWKRLGLSDRKIRMIKNYEAKGGRFRKKEDLARIYAINDADYARLAPYIAIEIEPDPTRIRQADSSTWTDRPIAQSAAPEIFYIDLNGADSLELQYLPGIGPVFASRIIRFRDLLGGFHDVSQLMDVYGLDSVRFDALKTHVYVDTSKLEKIPINTAEYQRFRDHPFLNHKLANAIVQYRKQHGPYGAISDLLRIAIMDEQIFRKIAPYLTLAND